ncbi:hypothetical protein CBR_g30469 [Chara braunii]|uniref:Uncharacterized protein n=1 Tax=Chara braunii TaxID=69332 RepID=A0A388LD24_CHABU|nr:hypothetical protein CBR_g30469 [Chara braunii]|eukprot:GBG80102.1 hypothetical protein CBR_g30469 [Chara braunii]
MPRKQTLEHEPAPEHVQQDYRHKSVVYRYIVVGQKVDNRGVNMLRCTFCNKVFQGTQFYATKHFTQQNYCKKVSDDALYQIAQKCTHRFEADQVERVRRFAHERGFDVPRSGAMGGEAERPAQGVGEGEDTERYAEGGIARYGEGAGAAEEDEADVDLEVGVVEGERTPRGEGGVPKSDPMAHQRAVDWERKCGKKVVPPETTCTPISSKSAVPDRASTPASSKRKEGGAQLSGTSVGKRLRQQKMTDTYSGEWIGEWRKAFFRWVYSSKIAFNAFCNTSYGDLQQVALRQPGGAPPPVLPSYSEIADMRTVEIYREQLAEELEDVTQPLWDRLQGMMTAEDGRAWARIPWSPNVRDMARWVRRQIRWSPWWERMRAIKHVMDPVMDLLRRMDRGGQFMSLVVEWTRDLARLVRDACIPLGQSFSDRIIRRVQARIQHMMEPAHCAAFLLNPHRRNVQYFSAQLDRYHTWLVRQAKRYLLSQTGHGESGGRYLEVCRQFEDFHMQQCRYGSWGGAEGRARARSCIGDCETLECASWWFQYGGDAPDLQHCALRLMHMWSCTFPAERNRAVHEGIHTKKRNQLAFEKVVHLVEIIANVWLMEYKRAGCGYVLPWQRDEGMLDAQAGLDVEPVRSGTRSGMMEEEIEEQAALIARDPIGSSAPPPVESVFGARATIFRPYSRDDDSADERESEVADDPMLPIPREIDELHEGGDVRDGRTHTAWRVADQRDMDMMGGEEFWGSFGGTEERSPTAAREDTRPRTTLWEETPAPMTASEEPGPATTARERMTVSSTTEEQTPAPMTTPEQTSIPATQSGPSSPSPLSLHSIPGFPASAPPAPNWRDERSPAPVGREDLGSSLRIRGHGSLFSVARQLLLDPRASSDLGEMGVHSGAPPVEERERRAEKHGAAGAGGVEGIRGMEEEVAGVVGGLVEVDDGAHVEREEAMARVDDGDDEGEEAMARDDEGEEAVAGVEESVAGIDDGDAQVEMEEDVVRADAAALVGGEEGVVGGDIAHGRGEGGGDHDPIIQRFVDDEMGPALAGLTSGTRRALGASPSGQKGASGLGMGDFMDMSLGDPPTPSHAEREDVARALAAAGYTTEEIEQAFAGRSERETDTPSRGARSSLVPFTGLQMTTTMRPVRPCVQGSGPGEEAFVQVPPVIVVDLGSEAVLHTPVTGRRAPQDTARPLDFKELARAAVRNVTRREDTDPSRPLMPPPPPRSRHSDSPSTPFGRPPRSPSTPTRLRVRDTTVVGSLPLDTSLFGRTDIDLDSIRRVTMHTARQQLGLGGADTGRGAPREVMAAVSQPRDVREVGQAGCTLQAALAAATRAVREQTSRRSGVARTSSMPQMMPTTGDAALEESSGAEGLEMSRGSRREKTVAEVTQVSARLVRVRTGAAHVTVVEDDPETEPAREEAPQEGDEYRDDEEREEDESDNGDDDSYHDDDNEPSPPPRHGSRRRRGSRRGHDDVDDPFPPGRWETRSRRRRGSSIATAPGRGSVSSTRSKSGARQRGSGKGKGSRRY